LFIVFLSGSYGYLGLISYWARFLFIWSLS